MTERESSPVNEFTTAGYLTMSYPTIFIDGTGDITIKKDPTIKYFKRELIEQAINISGSL